MLKCDFCIIGSGFSGSLLAWILAAAGRSVVLIDSSRHPRFAIGESSTPLADFLLERIAEEFSLPELKPLARFGTWRASHPDLRCGLKRGFSYFQHTADVPFADDSKNSSSLLVAASASDKVADTHWHRSDVDAWLADRARTAGAVLHESAQSIRLIRQPHATWSISFELADETQSLTADIVVDASGSGHVIASSLGIESLSDRLQTRTGALFGHFAGVASAIDAAAESTGREPQAYTVPFSADDAAQHHLLGDKTWCWMLRFQDDLASVGIVGPAAQFTHLASATAREDAWRQQVARFPMLDRMLSSAHLVAPIDADNDGNASPVLGWSPRISRLWAQAAGQDLSSTAGLRGCWAMLPSTVGIVDPLHSTGIAHSLSGVYRLASAFLTGGDAGGQWLERYSAEVVQEILWIDEIVSLCRLAQTVSFDAFTAASAFYFVSAIHCERQLAQSSGLSTDTLKSGFLLHADQRLRKLLQAARERLEIAARSHGDRQRSSQEFVSWLRGCLSPWNDVGLLDPKLNNRIARASAPK